MCNGSQPGFYIKSWERNGPGWWWPTSSATGTRKTKKGRNTLFCFAPSLHGVARHKFGFLLVGDMQVTKFGVTRKNLWDARGQRSRRIGIVMDCIVLSCHYARICCQWYLGTFLRCPHHIAWSNWHEGKATLLTMEGMFLVGLGLWLWVVSLH
jgi:hypothetical protein